jgi:hypothetical protein
MQQRQLDVALSLQRLALYRSFGLHQFSTQVQVREGQLLAAPVRARLAPDGAEIDARLTLTQLPEEPARVAATLVTRGLDISPLLALTERPAEFSGGRVDVNLDLRAQGNSVRALMGSLEGQAQLVVGEALVDRRVFDLGADLLTEFVNLVNPFAKSDAATKLECIAVRLPVKDGVVTIDRSVALQTAKVNIVTSGVVNLRDETLNLYMQSRAREGLNLGLGKVTNMVKVTGTLAKPSYGVSAEGVIEAGLSTAAAVTTAGLSILVESLATKTLSDRTPCRTALGEGKAAKVTPPGSAEPDTAAPVGTTE